MGRFLTIERRLGKNTHRVFPHIRKDACLFIELVSSTCKYLPTRIFIASWDSY